MHEIEERILSEMLQTLNFSFLHLYVLGYCPQNIVYNSYDIYFTFNVWVPGNNHSETLPCDDK